MDSPADRLRKVRKERGFASARSAALRYGWKVPTYTSHENGTRDLTRAFADYAEKFRVSETWLRGLTDDRETGVKGTPVMGEAAVGVWRETPATSARKGANAAISVPLIEDEDVDGVRFSIHVADASINKALPMGSYAICEPCPARDYASHEFVVGDILYIERLRQGMREMSLRRVSQVGPDRLRLATFSTDSSLKQAELAYPSSASERIRLVGRVVGTYRDYKPK